MQIHFFIIIIAYGEYKLNVKNNIYSLTLDGKPYIWMNLDTKENMHFGESGAAVYISMTDSIAERQFKNTIDFNAVMANGWTCEVLGEIELNGRSTIVVRSYNKKSLISSIEDRYFIDKETGILAKADCYTLRGIIFVKDGDIYQEAEVKFDCVTDEDVKRPDLEGYTISN